MAKKTKSDEVSAAQILAQLERLSRLSRAVSHSAGLNPAQWDALRYLARCNRFSNSPMALTHYLGATKGTISQTVAALAKKAAVSKTVRAGNSRSVALVLTDLGKQLLVDDPLRPLETAIENLSDKTKKRFARGVSDVLDSERLRQNQPRFGTCSVCRFYRSSPDYCMRFEQVLSSADMKLICVEQLDR
jgi:DNA-binding MarR family transcriptional regulator